MTAPSQQPAPILELRGITKRFPGVVALREVSLALREGECLALVGENGAGKSTLGRVIAGIHAPEQGTVRLDGHPVEIRSPAEAARLGIGMVHQELAFCPQLSIAQNLTLGETPRRGPFIDRAAMHARARELLSAFSAEHLDVSRPIGQLSTAQEQLVQIAAAVGRGARIVIFDEPTSSLSSVETQHLFKLIRRLRDRGVTLIYVSHRMEEVFRVSDRVAVLRDGQLVAVRETEGLSRDDLVRLMIGREVADYFPEHEHQEGKVLLEVDGLSSPGKFRDVRFRLRAGEILGLGGLVGAGRSEIAKALFGLDPTARGRVVLNGEEIALDSPRAALRCGIGLVPEDRKREGLVLGMTIAENINLPTVRRRALGPFRRKGEERQVAGEFFKLLRIRANHSGEVTAGLSGGNQQKVALAKWLAAKSQVLMVDEPTRGVDLGAKAEIHKLIGQIAAEGRGVLLISSEMPELLNLSDRIIVLREGRVAGELAREEATEERLLRLMTGLEREAG